MGYEEPQKSGFLETNTNCLRVLSSHSETADWAAPIGPTPPRSCSCYDLMGSPHLGGCSIDIKYSQACWPVAGGGGEVVRNYGDRTWLVVVLEDVPALRFVTWGLGA